MARLTITALLAYGNHRDAGLPTTIWILAIALLPSQGLIAQDRLGFGALCEYETRLLQGPTVKRPATQSLTTTT